MKTLTEHPTDYTFTPIDISRTPTRNLRECLQAQEQVIADTEAGRGRILAELARRGQSTT